MKIDFLDVKLAYFHAKARRDVYVRLPKEDVEEGKCGKMNKSMYGTRDDAQNWEVENMEFLLGIGLLRGESQSMCVWHPNKKEIAVSGAWGRLHKFGAYGVIGLVQGRNKQAIRGEVSGAVGTRRWGR